MRSEESITPSKGSVDTGGEDKAKSDMPQAPNQANGDSSVMEWLVKQCGLKQADLDKLKEQQINENNIEFLTAEDLKNIGLPIGPSRQLYALILKLKKTSKNGQLQIPGTEQR